MAKKHWSCVVKPYNSLLNNGNSSNQATHDKLGYILSESKSIIFINSNLNSSLNLVVFIVCPHNILFVLTVLLIHFYLRYLVLLPTNFPIIKSKTGNTSYKNNYRPIALVTSTSKLFVYLKFYKCTLLHMITRMYLRQNIPMTCVYLQ